MIPDRIAETPLGAAGCASGSQAFSGNNAPSMASPRKMNENGMSFWMK